jgi:glycosyltransferase involved in cell wall biosynthesis
VTSCLKQTRNDIEVVVVDDCSTDKTTDYLDWLKENPKVKIIRNEKNLGRSASRNIGNDNASGDVICVLDADDLSTPNRAEITAKKFKDRKLDYLYGGATVIDVIGRPLSVLPADVFDKDKAVSGRMENRIVHSTVAYTRDFAREFPYCEGDYSALGIDDWKQQWDGVLGGARFDFATQRLACYRITNSQISKVRDAEKVAEAKRKFLDAIRVPA